MRKAVLVLACAAAMAAPGVARAATLTIGSNITVNGTDVFSGPTFTVVGNYSLTDMFALNADGEVGLADTRFYANAAGVITRPSTTNTGDQPGETSPGGPQQFPYAALLIGNTALGFRPVFPANAQNGLNDSTPPLALSVARTIGDLFGQAIVNGTVLEFRVNDINTGDNSGGFRLSPGSAVPEPASLALIALGLVGALRRRAR